MIDNEKLKKIKEEIEAIELSQEQIELAIYEAKVKQWSKNKHEQYWRSVDPDFKNEKAH